MIIFMMAVSLFSLAILFDISINVRRLNKNIEACAKKG